MVSSHWQHEKCAIVGCGKSRRIHNFVRKWTKDKLNASVVGWSNNQTPVNRPTQDQKHARLVSKGSSIKNVINSSLCRWSTKESYKSRYNYTTRFSKGGTWEHTTWGSKVWVSHNANWKEKMSISTCATALKKNDHSIGDEWKMQKQSKFNILKSRTNKGRPLAPLKKHVKWPNNEPNDPL